MKSIASERNAAQGSRKRHQEKGNTSDNRKKTMALKKFIKQSAEEMATLRKELYVMKEKNKEQNLTALTCLKLIKFPRMIKI